MTASVTYQANTDVTLVGFAECTVVATTEALFAVGAVEAAPRVVCAHGCLKKKSVDMEHENALDYWNGIVIAIKTCAQKALALLANRELDGDPNEGVTEVGFKLAILACLANLSSFSGLEVESEREVDGGRIDLFLYHEVTQSALVVELKYVRVGFLLSTEKALKLNYRAKHKLWREENDKMVHLSKKEKREVSSFSFSS